MKSWVITYNRIANGDSLWGDYENITGSTAQSALNKKYGKTLCD